MKQGESSAEVKKAQLKLIVDYINRIAVNFFAVGAITPVAALLFDVQTIAAETWQIAAAAGGFVATSVLIHYIAVMTLRGLDKWNS